MKLRKLVYANIAMLVIMNLGNVCNYLFQILAGRLLIPADFGLFNALNSLATIGSIPVFVLPIVMSRYTVELEKRGREYVAQLIHWSNYALAAFAVVLMVLGLLLVPGIKAYLNVAASLPVYLVIAYVAINLVRPAPWGVLQGLERFNSFSIVGGGGSLARLLFGVILLWLFPFGVNGAMWSGVLSNFVAWLLALWFLRDFAGCGKVALPRGLAGKMFAFALPAAASNALLLMFGNLDMILVKKFCTPDVAGHYASAMIFGRIVFYLTSVLGNVLFPKAAKGDRTSLVVCLVLTGLIVGGMSLLALLAGEHLASLLFGAVYADAGPLFKMMTFGMSLLAMAYVLIVYGLARQQYRFLWVQAIGVMALAISIYFKHDNAMDIATALVGSCALTFLGMVAWWFRLRGERAG